MVQSVESAWTVLNYCLASLSKPLFLDWVYTFSSSSTYRGCLENGSNDIVSAVCFTIYTIFLSLWTQTADPITSETSPVPKEVNTLCGPGYIEVPFILLYTSIYPGVAKKIETNKVYGQGRGG